jgi:hypothetical protein
MRPLGTGRWPTAPRLITANICFLAGSDSPV